MIFSLGDMEAYRGQHFSYLSMMLVNPILENTSIFHQHADLCKVTVLPGAGCLISFDGEPSPFSTR